MTGTHAGLPCEAVREMAPDVALGLLTGEERADALAHLESCEGCRAEVASLSVTADEVLLAAPEAVPPAGFADRVLALVAAERAAGDGLPAVSGHVPAAVPRSEAYREVEARSPRRARAGRDARDARDARPEHRQPRRLQRARLAAAALALAATVALVVGVVAVVRRDAAPEPEVASAVMATARGRVVGDAIAEGTGDGNGSARVTLDVPEWEAVVERWGAAPAGSYWLVVEHADGTRTMRALAADVYEWSMQVKAPVDELATVSMVDEDGRVWCTGSFAPA